MNRLHLMQAEINLHQMARWITERNHSDPDRALHCLMSDSFGLSNPVRPYYARISGGNGQRTGQLLGYSSLDARQLQHTARQNQGIAVETILQPPGIRTTPVPSEWQEGARLRFQVRVRPTKRRSNHNGDHPKWEYDIYRHNAPGGNECREQAYALWLTGALERQGGLEAQPGDIRMERFCHRKVKRQQNSNWINGPDATMTGIATVKDSGLVTELLRRGIGRHKGFGYGMVLLKAAA